MCDCRALYHSKETIKNLIALTDTETYKGVPAKHTLILLLSAVFLSSYTSHIQMAEGLETNAMSDTRRRAKSFTLILHTQPKCEYISRHKDLESLLNTID